MEERIKQRISKMCIAEIQKTFGLSKISAMRLKRGEAVNVTFYKLLQFLGTENLLCEID